MKPWQVVALVLGILLVNGLIHLTVWTLIFRKLRRIVAELPRELAAGGETVLHGPERAHYSGATSGFSNVRGLGVLALTDRRLVFRRVGGKTIEVALGDLERIDACQQWQRRRHPGSSYVAPVTRQGQALAFAIRAPSYEAWLAALDKTSIPVART